MVLRKEWVDEKEIKQLKLQVENLRSVADNAQEDLGIAEAEIERKKEEARVKAITNLGRYKFMNFGYWAAVWIHLNQLSGKKDPSPFKDFVDLARRNMTYEKYKEDRAKEEQQTNKGEDE